MQLPEPRLWLVDDPDDTPASTRALHALASLDNGAIVVRTTPGERRLQTVALDLLSALGKDLDRSARNGEENWRRGTAWLVGEQVRHLIVDRAEILRADRWRDFIGLASHCDTSLWLVCHGASLRRGQREMLDDWPLTQISFERFIVQHAAQRPPGGEEGVDAASPPAAFPTLPRSDFTTFRADCRRLLAPDAFDRVEVEMKAAADLTHRWLGDASDPDATTMKEHLRQLIEDCRTTGQAVARLRGAQAVCLMAGLLVTVDLERLAGSTQTVRPLIDRQLVDQLRAYSSPQPAAIAILACLTGASPEAISIANVDDMTADAVRIAGRTFAVPGIARCVIAAQLHHRLAAGALPQDALFSDAHRGELGQRSSARAIRGVISKVSKATGLMLWGEQHSQDDLSRQRWLHRRGVSVHVL